MLRSFSRTGSARAAKPPASASASVSESGAASTDGQHSVTSIVRWRAITTPWADNIDQRGY